MHYLLKYPRCEIGTLVRLNFFAYTKLCENLVKALIMIWDDIFQWNGFWISCRGTHDCQQITVSGFCFVIGSANTINNHPAKRSIVQVSMGLVLHSELVYQASIWRAWQVFTYTLPPPPSTPSTLANRNAAGFYPGYCLHRVDRSWVNYMYVIITVSLTCDLKIHHLVCTPSSHM